MADVKIRVLTDDQTTSEMGKINDALKQTGDSFASISDKLDKWIEELGAATPQNLEFAKQIAAITEAYKAGAMPADEAKTKLEAIRQEMDAGAPATQQFALSFTELNQAVELGQKVFEAINKIYDETIGKTLKLADSVRTISAVTGTSVVRIEPPYRGIWQVWHRG